MPQYRDKLISFLDEHEGEICEDCKRRKGTNPIRVLDCKNDHCQEIYTNAPKLIDNLSEECESDFKQLQQILDEHGMDYEIDTHLVRGLDYYSKTAFEFISTEIVCPIGYRWVEGVMIVLVEFFRWSPYPSYWLCYWN